MPAAAMIALEWWAYEVIILLAGEARCRAQRSALQCSPRGEWRMTPTQLVTLCAVRLPCECTVTAAFSGLSSVQTMGALCSD